MKFGKLFPLRSETNFSVPYVKQSFKKQIIFLTTHLLEVVTIANCIFEE